MEYQRANMGVRIQVSLVTCRSFNGILVEISTGLCKLFTYSSRFSAVELF
jgi:hypothetical protein